MEIEQARLLTLKAAYSHRVSIWEWEKEIAEEAEKGILKTSKEFGELRLPPEKEVKKNLLYTCAIGVNA